MGKDIIYSGQRLTLTKFFGERPCLWINNPHQINMPKMEFVGGYPDEYCIFIDKLSEFEKKQIVNLDGTALDLEKEIATL